MKKNPWTILDTTPIYDNPWINVTEYQVINPNGGEGIYGKVSFKNYALGIVPIDNNNNTWLVGQYRFATDEYSWEIPMGGGKLEHNPLASAQRELKEETGLTAREWHMIGRVHTSNSVCDEEGFIYVAKGLTQGDTAFDPTEDLSIKQLPFEEAMAMVLDGRITDAISIAAILKVSTMNFMN